MSDPFHDLEATIATDIRRALEEDVGAGDLTAALLPAGLAARARLVTRQDAVLCGTEWFDRTLQALDPDAEVFWHHGDGEDIVAGTSLCEIQGNARAILTAERTAINFLQTLSAIATRTRTYVRLVAGTKARIVDTRKTVPGLRVASKYAVRAGGGTNHRTGLFDGILLKENHLAAAGGVTPAVKAALAAARPGQLLQVEVETTGQLREALAAGAKLVLLDNFTLPRMREAVAIAAGRAELEASGGVDFATVKEVAETGVDRISIGSLTKDIQAVDFSLRFLHAPEPAR